MAKFDYPIVYEDRDELHTSRWALEGVNTTNDGNTDGGWLWMLCVDASNTVTVDLYKDAACGADDKVATGTADIPAVATAAAKCTLTVSNASGMSGEFCFESYTGDNAAAIPVCVSLCVDADLAVEYTNLSDLPATVRDRTNGMAALCAAASRKTLLLATQMYADELGGHGAPEHGHIAGATRSYPRLSVISNPDQLKDAATHWALMLAFGSCHELARSTMYSELRDYHDDKRKEAIASWRLALNLDPDDDTDADEMASAGAVRLIRT